MKMQTLDHPKLRRLMKLLDVPRYAAAGILETLWQLTAAHADAGDVGRFSNEEIADHLGWQGDHDKLVEALLTAGWLDESTEYRLVVHDWPDHAPEFIQKREKRGTIQWAMGNNDDSQRPLSADNGSQRPPTAANGSIVKSSLAKPRVAKKSQGAADAAFDSFWNHVPKKAGKQAARKAYADAVDRVAKEQSIPKSEASSFIVGRIQAFAASPKARGQFCPYPATWLTQGRYDDDPATWESIENNDSNPSDPRGTMDAMRGYLEEQG